MTEGKTPGELLQVILRDVLLDVWTEENELRKTQFSGVYSAAIVTLIKKMIRAEIRDIAKDLTHDLAEKI